jgi:hypothetical protein
MAAAEGWKMERSAERMYRRCEQVTCKCDSSHVVPNLTHQFRTFLVIKMVQIAIACVTTHTNITIYMNHRATAMGARDSVVVKALCYKPEGRGFKTR